MVQKLLQEPIDISLMDEVADPGVAHKIHANPQYFH